MTETQITTTARIQAAIDEALTQADYRGIVESETDPNKPLDLDDAAKFVVREATWPGYEEDDISYGQAVLEYPDGEYRADITSMEQLSSWSFDQIERAVAEAIGRAAADVYACPVGGNISGEVWGFAGYMHHANAATTSSQWAVKVRRHW